MAPLKDKCHMDTKAKFNSFKKLFLLFAKCLFSCLLLIAILSSIINKTLYLKAIVTYLTLLIFCFMIKNFYAKDPKSYTLREMIIIYGYGMICCFIWFPRPLNFVFFAMGILFFSLHLRMVKKSKQ